jgi:hypothetical protein
MTRPVTGHAESQDEVTFLVWPVVDAIPANETLKINN